MATRSSIGYLNDDGTVTAIYCHWDGYTSHNGKLLVDHYDTPDKIQELLNLGNLSTLAEKIGEKHPFGRFEMKDGDVWDEDLYRTWCTSFMRDREEKDQQSQNYISIQSYLNEFFAHVAYHYLFRDGEWEVYSNSKKGGWFKVKEVLANE